MMYTPTQWRDAVNGTANEIAKCMLSLDGAIVGDPSPLPETSETMVGAHIPLVGKQSFDLSFVASPAGCEALSRAVLGFSPTDAVDAGTVADAVGELVNMLGGGVKRRIGSDLELGLPVFVSGVPRASERQAIVAIPVKLGDVQAVVVIVGPRVAP
ncbi:MAG TPA: chemotaxis protein CheX [Kofleriaceae bacterium]|nr:chemotaxis protein CheX [Kofleriaceae bacterium]